MFGNSVCCATSETSYSNALSCRIVELAFFEKKYIILYFLIKNIQLYNPLILAHKSTRFEQENSETRQVQLLTLGMIIYTSPQLSRFKHSSARGAGTDS